MNMNYTPPKKTKLVKYCYGDLKNYYSGNFYALTNKEWREPGTLTSIIKFWFDNKETSIDVDYYLRIGELTFMVKVKEEDSFLVELVKWGKDSIPIDEVIKFSRGEYLDKTIFILGKQYREGDDGY